MTLEWVFIQWSSIICCLTNNMFTFFCWINYFPPNSTMIPQVSPYSQMSLFAPLHMSSIRWSITLVGILPTLLLYLVQQYCGLCNMYTSNLIPSSCYCLLVECYKDCRDKIQNNSTSKFDIQTISPKQKRTLLHISHWLSQFSLEEY